MATHTLTWATVDHEAAVLGATPTARMKWRQRQVPFEWRIKIVEALMSKGMPVALADFEKLPTKPGRIAA